MNQNSVNLQLPALGRQKESQRKTENISPHAYFRVNSLFEAGLLKLELELHKINMIVQIWGYMSPSLHVYVRLCRIMNTSISEVSKYIGLILQFNTSKSLKLLWWLCEREFRNVGLTWPSRVNPDSETHWQSLVSLDLRLLSYRMGVRTSPLLLNLNIITFVYLVQWTRKYSVNSLANLISGELFQSLS